MLPPIPNRSPPCGLGYPGPMESGHLNPASKATRTQSATGSCRLAVRGYRIPTSDSQSPSLQPASGSEFWRTLPASSGFYRVVITLFNWPACTIDGHVQFLSQCIKSRSTPEPSIPSVCLSTATPVSRCLESIPRALHQTPRSQNPLQAGPMWAHGIGRRFRELNRI
jgi:hypothetical protein